MPAHDLADPGFLLAQWKAVLTTVLLFLALLQALEQTVLRDKVRLRRHVCSRARRRGGNACGA
ncbi:MAG: hypothetical protein ACP5OO_01260 [Chloroflexia bacterium]